MRWFVWFHRIVVIAGLMPFATIPVSAQYYSTEIPAAATAPVDFLADLDSDEVTIIVFLDVCHAGATSGGTNDGAVEELLEGTGKPLLIVSASKGHQFRREGAAFGGVGFARGLGNAQRDRPKSERHSRA